MACGERSSSSQFTWAAGDSLLGCERLTVLMTRGYASTSFTVNRRPILVLSVGAVISSTRRRQETSIEELAIAVGFVVDDAIVMLENIDRHIWDGLSPMEAAIKGAGEIGFTIVSISLSLIA